MKKTSSKLVEQRWQEYQSLVIQNAQCLVTRRDWKPFFRAKRRFVRTWRVPKASLRQFYKTLLADARMFAEG